MGKYIYEGTKGVPLYHWTQGVVLEEGARQQLHNIAQLPFIHKHVAAMPDVHWGMGATIGSVIATKGAVVPAAVGVDLGCVDTDTEFLSRSGWKKISDYEDGDEVLIYSNPELGEEGKAFFEKPLNYIKLPCNEFWHIRTKYGVDQMLSDEHRVLVYLKDRGYLFNKHKVVSAKDLASKHNELVNGFVHKFLTSFKYESSTSLDITDEVIRVVVMVCADAHIRNYNTGNCILNLKKERKIARAKVLLEDAKIPYKLSVNSAGNTLIYFNSPVSTKCLSYFWEASEKQLKVIVSEAYHWDGSLKNRCYYTRSKASADFINFAMTSCGLRSTISVDERDSGTDYRVFSNGTLKVGIAGSPKSNITRTQSVDGFKYCFTTKTGFWVMRRNGNICVTGNCGMMAVKTTLTATDLPDNLHPIRCEIEEAVPHGRTDNGGQNDKGGWGSNIPNNIIDRWLPLSAKYANIIAKHPKTKAFNNVSQLGTLGTGNHFIEVCLDENDTVWVMLHSGSRGAGNKIGMYFIEQAKREMEKYHISSYLPDKDLSYLVEHTELYNDYVDAVEWAQEFALENRKAMMEATLKALRKHLKPFSLVEEAVNCHHNYISKENHFGSNVIVTRKGAVRARKGDLGIIPGSMGTGSFIVRGLGNEQSFCSCSHGAGRVMSRNQAKKEISLNDHVMAMKGIEARLDKDVLDESPAAYKDIGAVMEAQSDLVEIVYRLRQVINVKG